MDIFRSTSRWTYFRSPDVKTKNYLQKGINSLNICYFSSKK